MECKGVLVKWKPGSVWDTYPYHQHEDQSVAWEPIAIENHGWLRLRSQMCAIMFHTEDLSIQTCRACRAIPNSAHFRRFMDRASYVSEHTPWQYLNYRQLCSVIEKVTAQNKKLRLKVL